MERKYCPHCRVMLPLAATFRCDKCGRKLETITESDKKPTVADIQAYNVWLLHDHILPEVVQ